MAALTGGTDVTADPSSKVSVGGPAVYEAPERVRSVLAGSSTPNSLQEQASEARALFELRARWGQCWPDFPHGPDLRAFRATPPRSTHGDCELANTMGTWQPPHIQVAPQVQDWTHQRAFARNSWRAPIRRRLLAEFPPRLDSNAMPTRQQQQLRPQNEYQW